jgi:alkyl hydroperoxide reductase subunit AhpC
VTLEKISKEEIAEINLEIIKSEFSDVFKHLQWHRFNRIALGKESLISQKEIADKYSRIQKSALQNTDVFLLKIPLNKKISNYIDLDGIYF